MSVPRDDEWGVLDRAATAHGLGLRQIVHKQKLSPLRLIALTAALTLVVGIGNYAWNWVEGRPITVVQAVIVTVATWLLLLALVGGWRVWSMRKRGMRMAFYDQGLVVQDADQLHVARWDELSMSYDDESAAGTVTIAFRPPQGTSVVQFNNTEWQQAPQIAAQLKAKGL